MTLDVWGDVFVMRESSCQCRVVGMWLGVISYSLRDWKGFMAGYRHGRGTMESKIAISPFIPRIVKQAMLDIEDDEKGS